MRVPFQPGVVDSKYGGAPYPSDLSAEGESGSLYRKLIGELKKEFSGYSPEKMATLLRVIYALSLGINPLRSTPGSSKRNWDKSSWSH